MKNALRYALIGLLLAGVAATWSRERMVDIDGDGYKEARVFYAGPEIIRTLIDGDHDGNRETVIYYKNGHRDRGEQDTDGDGKVDRWISYYFTGVPWKVAEDMDRDGRPDYWMYLKNGKIYKWEQDRNGDGKPDLRTTYEPDGKIRVLVQQSSDDDLDGIFETLSGITSAKKEAAVPHSLAEALLRY